MNKAVETRLNKSRPGGWIPQDGAHVERWIRRIKHYVNQQPRALVPPIAELRDLVNADPALHAQAEAMFKEAWRHKHQTPLGQPEVRSFEEFLGLLNGIMTTAPEAYQDIPSQEPSGLIGFPINALLDWPMATRSGYQFFANALVNQQFKKILDYWAQFLQSPASRYVLTEPVSRLDRETLVVPWLGKAAKAEMVQVATKRSGRGPTPLRAASSRSSSASRRPTTTASAAGMTSSPDVFGPECGRSRRQRMTMSSSTPANRRRCRCAKR